MRQVTENYKRFSLIRPNYYVLHAGGFLYDISICKAQLMKMKDVPKVLGISDFADLLKHLNCEYQYGVQEILYLNQTLRPNSYNLHILIFKPINKYIVIKEVLPRG